MGPDDSKSYQLRVRVTAEERELLEKLRSARGRGETLSDLVREALSMLTKPEANGSPSSLSYTARTHIERLAVLLKREPRQVEEACVEGIVDLIEHKCDVPLIVMETHLHLKYRARDDKSDFPWTVRVDTEEPEAPAPATVPVIEE